MKQYIVLNNGFMMKNNIVYLFADYWRGSLNVASMRTFSTYEKLLKHVKKVAFYPFQFRAYKYSVDKNVPPELINKQLLNDMGDLSKYER